MGDPSGRSRGSTSWAMNNSPNATQAERRETMRGLRPRLYNAALEERIRVYQSIQPWEITRAWAPPRRSRMHQAASCRPP